MKHVGQGIVECYKDGYVREAHYNQGVTTSRFKY